MASAQPYLTTRLISPTPSGAAGDGSVEGVLSIGTSLLAGNYPTIVKAGTGGLPLLAIGPNQLALLPFKIVFNGKLTTYLGVGTAALGLSPIYGLDNRTGVVAVDAAAITLYTTTAAGQAYHLLAHIFARGGTTPTGSYVVTFTEGGVAITKTMSVTAIDTDSDISIPCQPDNGTTITAQLTAIGGTTPSMDCYTSVKEEA